MEGATKRDPGCSKTSNEVYGFYGHMKLLENQQVDTVSVVSALQAELVHARTRIHELETERRSSKKKVEHYLKKLHEERTAWMRREHHKVGAIIDDLKDELNREKRNCQRMEIMNSKLLNDLADAKLSAKQFMQDYEKEREARELLEEACNELAKKIVEDKTEVEALKSEAIKICEEVEEERKMLQMAEVWREERVQMKLVDVKLILEEKYCQLNNLIADLETFLKSKDVTLDMIEMSEAEVIKQAASSVNIQEIKEFSYKPPKSDDIYSRIEELQNGQAKGREIDQCLNSSPSSHASKIQRANCEVYGFNKNRVQMHANGFTDHDRGLENTSGLETVTHAEDQGSSYTPNGSNCSVNRISRGRNISRSGTEHEQSAGQESLNSEIIEVCLVSTKQIKKKAPSASKLWRSCPTNGDVYKTISAEGSQRLSNGSASHVGTISPDRGSGQADLGHQDLLGPWSSPDSGNPHITRGMKGCIEWPRGIQRTSLKAKLLEARVESQKTQLRSVLKHKS
uniref:Uncharacterized protein n=1 Tax=Davidia involucrata TaxID=16924 RepID=A0A5B7AXG7_DAVIN